MVRTEEIMIVNQINSHHIDHHYIIHDPGILYILNLMNFFMKKNCTIPSINPMIFKMIMEMKGSMKGEGDLLILTLIGEANF